MLLVGWNFFIGSRRRNVMKRCYEVFWGVLALLWVPFLGAQEDTSLTNLDSFLATYGYHLSPVHSERNAGYCSLSQKAAFTEDLQRSSGILKIAEIGFNAGHSSEIFLENCPKATVTSFDINFHPYTKVGVEFMQKKYPGRFQFVEGDSICTVPSYSQQYPGEKFDLIYIDGWHSFDYCYRDIQNCQKIATKDTIVWIDDYNYWEVKKAIDTCVSEGLIHVLDSKIVTDSSGVRAWAIVKYAYLSIAEKIFSEIYRCGTWGKDQLGRGTSGPGSTLPQGLPFVHYIQQFLDSHEIHSVVDIGCGDWELAKEIDWGNRNYVGIDVVESVVKQNQVVYETDQIRFLHLNAVVDPLPKADLLICKDVLAHLSFAEISSILSKAKQFKYCIFVNHVDPSGKTKNYDIQTGEFYYLDLTKPPFNLVPAESFNYSSDIATNQILLFICNSSGGF
jgi:SAM-dependent methyltransferase